MPRRQHAILFVCLGNICRSPLAEGLFNASAHADSAGWHADSAGTGDWHVGEAPDPRSIAIARRGGIDIGSQRCRQIVPADFSRFSVILGMDSANVEAIRRIGDGPAQIGRFLDFAGPGGDVADPWTGGEAAFGACYAQIREAIPGIMARLAAWPDPRR